ncbi:MAG: hypothetical protein ACO3EM_02735 [Ilumatobacteraceae bacterium]|nr:hypothetical protein [Actinomycetota bacterium]
MFFWFIATAVLTIAWVFKDPRFDYRLLAVGAVLPDVVDWPTGWRVMHSVMTSIAVLALVMFVSLGRKPYRKILLGLPIGMFLHLVFDGAFTSAEMFWWPIGGWPFSADDLPVVARGWWNLPLEILGAAALWLWWRRRLATA